MKFSVLFCSHRRTECICRWACCGSPLFAFSVSGTVSKPKCVLLSSAASLKQRQDDGPKQEPDRPETPAGLTLIFLWDRRITLRTKCLMDAAMLPNYTTMRQLCRHSQATVRVFLSSSPLPSVLRKELKSTKLVQNGAQKRKKYIKEKK